MGHTVLSIVKGIAKVPGDALSAEQGVNSVDLLDTNGGFALETYEMKIPALKSSAVFADSPLNDGRTLIAGALGNVNETIRLTLTAGTIVQLSAMLSKLLRFKKDCNDFWDTFNQIEPVYIKHQVSGEPAPRYALLYDIDIAIESPTNPGEPTRDLTIVIERETDWSAIAPGANPKQWTAYKNNVKFNSAYATLYEGGSHIVYDTTVSNAIEFSSAFVISGKNYIDIPASSIPGDAPARVTITMGNFGDNTELYIAKSTKPTSITDRLGNIRPLFNAIPAAGALLAVGVVLTTDAVNGVRYAPATGINRSVLISTPGGAVEEDIGLWRGSAPFGVTGLNLSVMRGRYAVFLRALQIGGTAGQTTARLEMGLNVNGLLFFDSGQVRMGLSGSESNLMYMGIVNIPFEGQVFNGFGGLGLAVEQTSDFFMKLWSTRSAGASTQRFIDIVLMPIDEGMVYIKPEVSGQTTMNMFDNTGYMTHGKPEPYASTRDFVSGEQPYSTEVRGDLTLTPGVNNRLYFLAYNSTTLDSNAGAGVGVPVRVNIVPRWSGLRDV